jgi:carbon-monoxide dehydrogenase large subunit
VTTSPTPFGTGAELTGRTFGIGGRRPRVEDGALLTGRARYVGDLPIEGVLHAAFVRSMFAHARITHVDPAAALALPGVVAVFTADDLELGPVYFPGLAALLASDEYHRRPLARDTARFVGEIVALVVAETPAAADDAVELIVVDYDPLPVVLDPVAAAGDGAALLFPEAGSNVAVRVPFESGERSAGDAICVRAVIGNHRMAAAPLEGNAITAVPDAATGRITAYVSTQFPHALRNLSAGFLGLEPDDLRLVTPAVGGGFGGKAPIDPEYVAVLAVARRLGRPVRWVQSRSENLLTMHARGHRFEVTLRATREGHVTSVEVDALTDVGAYPGIGCAMIMTTRTLATGPYDIPHVVFDIRCVATNTAPTGAFRGAGRPEAIAMLERAMDVLAHELDLDPVELRRRNLIQPEQFPYRTATGVEYDSGDYERALDEALRIAGYDELRAEQARRRERSDSRYLGIGVSCYVEVSAGSPGMTAEYASVEVTPAGRVRILAGTCAHGQGHHTTYAQIVASVLGIPVEQVDFVDGDTDLVPRGAGTAGSRSAQVGGSAVKVASDAVLEKARVLAAHLLEADPSDIVIGDGGGLGVQGVPASTLSWATLAEAASDPARLPPGMEPGLAADPGFDQGPTGTAPFGCHIAVVEVDGETGAVELLRIVAVDDCGTVINPLLAEGQVHGGLLAGIGQALFEEVAYDDGGNPLHASFADYAFPSSADLPSYETHHTVTPTPHNPLGAKGVGEAGTTGSLAAVHNAVVDAVAHLGIRHIELPLTPFNVWQAIAAAQLTPAARPPAESTTP